MKPIVATLLLLSVLFAAFGCKRSERAGPVVMLDQGNGAIMVVFQPVPDADRETWLSQITLVGNSDTKTLPRIPLADEQSLLVFNVPPGFYSVVAQAWLRKNPPHAGGSLSGVEVRSGRLTILQGPLLTGAERFQPVEPLRVVKSVPWTLQRTERFHEYIADLIKSSVKG
jgi:hypothetical protein